MPPQPLWFSGQPGTAAELATISIKCPCQPLVLSAAAGLRGRSSTQKNEDVLVPLLVKFLLARPDLTSWSKVRHTRPHSLHGSDSLLLVTQMTRK